MVIKLPFKLFGQNGIAWFFPLVFVYGGLEPQELERVIQNEKVHILQWLECGIIFFPFVYLYFYLSRRFKRFNHRTAYYTNPMEVDSRRWDHGSLEDRPPYYWLKIIKD